MATRRVHQLVRERFKSGTISTQEALHFFQRFLAAPDPPPSLFCFNQHLAALLRNDTSSNHFPTLVSLFNHLIRARRITPNEHTYMILIDYCFRTNQVSLVSAVLGRFLREATGVNAAIFSPLIRGLCGENRIGEAVAMVFEKMPKLGCVPDVITYNILIKGLSSKGKNALALQLLLKMVKLGGECEPDVITYNTVIDGLCKENKLSTAIGFYKYMRSAGVIPNTVTYSSLINGLCKKRLLDKANELLQAMISEGPDPDLVTYNTIISGHVKNDEIDKAEKFLEVMVSKGVRPDTFTYSSIMHGYSKIGRWKEAISYFRIMVDQGISPDEITYGAVIGSLCKQGQSKEAHKVLDLMVARGLKPGIVPYRTLLLGYASHGTLTDVMGVLDTMVSHVAPDCSTYSLLIKMYIKKGKVVEALSLVERMKLVGLNQNLISHILSDVRSVCANGNS